VQAQMILIIQVLIDFIINDEITFDSHQIIQVNTVLQELKWLMFLDIDREQHHDII
jgi:hypothetical protein